jgi:uncharacterized phiE125 gp8 family phage protein
MRSSLDTAPTGLALHWDHEVKSHLRLDTDEERARVESLLIPTATEWVQALTNRQLLTATYVFLYSSFAEAAARGDGLILVPRPPLQSVVSIKYHDAGNDQQTWDPSDYVVTIPEGPKASCGIIRPASNSVFYPSTFCRPDAVEIKAVCGYGASYTNVPPGLRQAMLVLVGEMFERREHAAMGSVSHDVALNAQHLALPFVVEV